MAYSLEAHRQNSQSTILGLCDLSTDKVPDGKAAAAHSFGQPSYPPVSRVRLMYAPGPISITPVQQALCLEFSCSIILLPRDVVELIGNDRLPPLFRRGRVARSARAAGAGVRLNRRARSAEPSSPTGQSLNGFRILRHVESSTPGT
jgi:hypothetical protein